MAKKGFTEVSPKQPPGFLYRHSKTKGWYWRIAMKYTPMKLRTSQKTLSIPLKPRGDRGATRSVAMARDCQRRLWQQWQQQQGGAEPIAMDEWIERFRQWNELKASADQAQYNAQGVRRFVIRQGIIRPYDITVLQLEAYLTDLKSQGRAERTLIRHRNLVGMFCKFLRRRGEHDHNPAEEIDLKRPPKVPPRYLDLQQIRQLLDKAKSESPWLYGAISIGLFQGPRRGDIRQLRWQDFKPGGVVLGSRKTGNWRVMPTFPETAALLKVMPRGKPDQHLFPQYDLSWWGREMRKFTRDLPVFGELPGRRTGNQWHLLRATFAVQRARGVGLDKPATLWQLMAWLGHKDAQTTMRYVNIAMAAGTAKPGTLMA